LVVAAAVTALWILLNLRYGYRLEDSVLYLPIAKHYANPLLYADNPLLDHLRRMPYPLYRAMGWVFAGPWGAYGHVAMAVVMRWGFVAVLWLFMNEVTRCCWAALFGCLAVILQPVFYGTLAWTELISPEFVQSDLGKMVLMGAVTAYLRGHPVPTALILGVGFNIHPIFSLATAAMLAPDAIWRIRRFGFRRIVTAVAAGVIPAIPTVLGIIRSLGSSGACSEGDHIALVRFFNYFHVFPREFHRWEYVGFLGPTAAGVVAFTLIAPGLRERRGILLRLAMGIGVWCAIGVVFVEWLPRIVVMQMMPFRVTFALRLLATAVVVLAALEMTEKQSGGLFCLGAVWMGVIMLAVRFVPWVTLIVAGWLLATRRDFRSALALAVAAGATAMIVRINPDQLPWAGRFPWSVVVVVVAAGFVWSIGWANSGTLTKVTCAVALALTGIIELPSPVGGTWQPRLAARSWLSPEGYDVDRDDWQGVMRWARTCTHPDAWFITPPDLLGWTYYSERNTLATYQLGMQSVWDGRYGPMMKARLAEIGCVQRWAAGPNYHAFPPGQLLDVARRHGIDYVVWKKTEPNRMPWAVAYENGTFLVYDVRSVPARAGLPSVGEQGV